ncbi:G-protein coupled receptor moody-like [Tachypleus tridentatus]|uniref:G-protein coupled receptor moody-like n=1 Tax=Tachypleus tridentatus TaxID=6853 RepID=UPI003FCEFAB6
MAASIFPFQNLTTQNKTETYLELSSTVSPITQNLAGVMYVAAFCIIVLSIVGICGNLLTIVAIARCPRVHNATAVFIVSLSVSDFIYCTFNLPFGASEYIYQRWIFSDTLCIVFPFVQYFNGGSSLLLISAITINRYILIVHPSVYKKVYRKCYIIVMIITIWLFVLVLLVPTLLGTWGRFGYDEKTRECDMIEVNGHSSKYFLFTFGFSLPSVIIVFCYTWILWVIKRSSRRLHKYNNVQRNDRDAKKRQEEWRLTRMVLIIFCCFVFCFLPQTIIKVVDKNTNYPILHIVGFLLICSSSCINPIIYGVTNKQYRQAYKTALLFKRPANRTTNVKAHNKNGTNNNQPRPTFQI